MGPDVWLATLYLREKEGWHPVKGATVMDGVESDEAAEMRKGIRLGDCYLIIAGTFMRHR